MFCKQENFYQTILNALRLYRILHKTLHYQWINDFNFLKIGERYKNFGNEFFVEGMYGEGCRKIFMNSKKANNVKISTSNEHLNNRTEQNLKYAKRAKSEYDLNFYKTILIDSFTILCEIFLIFIKWSCYLNYGFRDKIKKKGKFTFVCKKFETKRMQKLIIESNFRKQNSILHIEEINRQKQQKLNTANKLNKEISPLVFPEGDRKFKNIFFYFDGCKMYNKISRMGKNMKVENKTRIRKLLFIQIKLHKIHRNKKKIMINGIYIHRKNSIYYHFCRVWEYLNPFGIYFLKNNLEINKNCRKFPGKKCIISVSKKLNKKFVGLLKLYFHNYLEGIKRKNFCAVNYIENYSFSTHNLKYRNYFIILQVIVVIATRTWKTKNKQQNRRLYFYCNRIIPEIQSDISDVSSILRTYNTPTFDNDSKFILFLLSGKFNPINSPLPPDQSNKIFGKPRAHQNLKGSNSSFKFCKSNDLKKNDQKEKRSQSKGKGVHKEKEKNDSRDSKKNKKGSPCSRSSSASSSKDSIQGKGRCKTKPKAVKKSKVKKPPDEKSTDSDTSDYLSSKSEDEVDKQEDSQKPSNEKQIHKKSTSKDLTSSSLPKDSNQSKGCCKSKPKQAKKQSFKTPPKKISDESTTSGKVHSQKSQSQIPKAGSKEMPYRASILKSDEPSNIEPLAVSLPVQLDEKKKFPDYKSKQDRSSNVTEGNFQFLSKKESLELHLFTVRKKKTEFVVILHKTEK